MYNLPNNSGEKKNFGTHTGDMKNLIRTNSASRSMFSTASMEIGWDNNQEIRAGISFPHIHTTNSIRI